MDGFGGSGVVFSMDEPEEQGANKVRIKVVGVGGAGGNAVNRMIQAGLKDVEFIAVNTDYQDLEKSLAHSKVAIGQKLTRGLGTGGRPERGEQAAVEDMAVLTEHLQGADLVFIAAGMGGGTGTGAAPVVARLACEAGALTVAVVTKPFGMEGRHRDQNAKKGLERLMEAAATLIVIPNDNLLSRLSEDVSLEEAFQTADDVLRQGVQGITDLITKPGLINRDFEDVRTVLSAGGRAVMGMGFGVGEKRALNAAEKAASNPLLEDASIQGARSVLINIAGDRSLKLQEVKLACEFVREKAHPDANVLWGSSVDESLKDEVRITVVAAAFEQAEVKTMPALRKPAFAAAAESLPVAAVGGAFGSVPGVDAPIPVTGTLPPPPAPSAPAPSSGFFRNGLFGGKNTPSEALPSQPARDYEKEQTPTFLRQKRRD